MVLTLRNVCRYCEKSFSSYNHPEIVCHECSVRLKPLESRILEKIATIKESVYQGLNVRAYMELADLQGEVVAMFKEKIKPNVSPMDIRKIKKCVRCKCSLAVSLGDNDKGGHCLNATCIEFNVRVQNPYEAPCKK